MCCLLAAFALTVVAGCVVTSDRPLTEPQGEGIEAALIGTWTGEEEGAGFLHIGKGDKTGMLRLACVEFTREGELRIEEYRGHVSSLGENTYLNVREVHEDVETGEWVFLKYQAAAGAFSMSLPETAPFEMAIKEGTLNGKVVKDKWARSVHVSEEPAKLQQFVLDHDSELFKEWSPFHKLEQPKGKG